MNYQQYQLLCEEIVASTDPQPPYNNPVYLHYAKLNVSRMNRWWKQLVLNETLVTTLKRFTSPQHWIMIAETWCGDAAPAIPFLVKLSEINPLFTYDIHLRDQEPFLINTYLTNGSKSIPKLIVRDHAGNDLFTWGPRPAKAQVLVDELAKVNADLDTKATQLQNWYNQDMGQSMQAELLSLFEKINTPLCN